ncbi:uncharacterized protein MEPE_00954 [Melanopsichium pennsylvanicum]|uniref:Uncharacterized protein n=2 Tax=Melanopsichium pennsylvanicum TaxID=63383 RepID=A0AAJ4XHI0_9BASI|nr:uncharacterized protein BN887_06042 [Melanopsichium pennsylvanicum 4]SNX82248.1 uncharacterized protein MEPE_00954 [Melanopsichium pennsylvanicum]
MAGSPETSIARESRVTVGLPAKTWTRDEGECGRRQDGSSHDSIAHDAKLVDNKSRVRSLPRQPRSMLESGCDENSAIFRDAAAASATHQRDTDVDIPQAQVTAVQMLTLPVDIRAHRTPHGRL